MGKRVSKGVPEGYAAAMRKANFTLPSTVVDGQHGILQPLSAWTVATRVPNVMLTLLPRKIIEQFD
jgi:hypothetical protein